MRFVQLKDDKNNIFYDKLSFIYLTMPNFTKTESELITDFDKWLYVLKNMSKLKEIPKVLQERIFKKLFEQAELAKFTPQERSYYHESLKVYRDNKNVLDTAIAEGIEKGIELGRKEMQREMEEAQKKAEETERKLQTERFEKEDAIRQLNELKKLLNDQNKK